MSLKRDGRYRARPLAKCRWQRRQRLSLVNRSRSVLQNPDQKETLPLEFCFKSLQFFKSLDKKDHFVEELI